MSSSQLCSVGAFPPWNTQIDQDEGVTDKPEVCDDTNTTAGEIQLKKSEGEKHEAADESMVTGLNNSERKVSVSGEDMSHIKHGFGTAVEKVSECVSFHARYYYYFQ